jgi:hypothetical protein
MHSVWAFSCVFLATVSFAGIHRSAYFSINLFVAWFFVKICMCIMVVTGTWQRRAQERMHNASLLNYIILTITHHVLKKLKNFRLLHFASYSQLSDAAV